MKVSEEMVTRLLTWPLPKSVRPDPCVMDQDYPHRVGTNLLTAVEARQMLEHVLGGVEDPSKPVKPPVGILSREIYWENVTRERVTELFAAMCRYAEAKQPIPVEWLDELHDFLTDKNRKQ